MEIVLIKIATIILLMLRVLVWACKSYERVLVRCDRDVLLNLIFIV